MVWREESNLRYILLKGTYVPEYLYDFLYSFEKELNSVLL